MVHEPNDNLGSLAGARRKGGREAALHALSALLFVLGYCAINSAFIAIAIEHLQDHVWKSVAGQVVISAVSISLLYPLFLAARRRARFMLFVLVALGAFINIAYIEIVKARLTFDSAIWLLEETGQGMNVVLSYTRQVAWSVGVVVLGMLLWAVSLRVHDARRWHVRALASRRYILGLCALLTAGWNFALFASGSTRHPHETNMLTYTLASRFMAAPQAQTVQGFEALPEGQFDQVVLVVDESVRYDYFRAVVRDEFEALGLIDMGEAISFSPCSAASNAMLRWGYSREMAHSVTFDPRAHPKIWRHAKRAGFATYFVDGQTKGSPQNFMGAEEFGDIDHKMFWIGDDMAIARSVRELLRDGSRKFIYVVKKGPHYSYESNYPPEVARHIKTRSASYAAAIMHTTSGFMRTMLDGVDVRRTLVVYTSDHGQRLDGSGASHCNYVPHAGEYSVPIEILAPDANWTRRLKSAAAQRDGVFSHAQIFPTLLVAMGYDEAVVTDRYFCTLFDKPASAFILRHPYKPYPNFRAEATSVQEVAGLAAIGARDSTSDPPP